MLVNPRQPNARGFLAVFKKLLNDSFWYSLGGVVTRLASFLLIPLYTHYLSSSDYGIVGLTATATSFIALIFSLGLPEAVMRFYVDYEHDAQLRKTFLTTILVFQMALCGLFGLLLSLTGAGISGQIFKEVPFSPFMLLAVWIGMFQVLFATVPLQLFRIRQQSLRYTVFNGINTLLIAAITIYLVVFKSMGALGQLYGLFLSSLVMIVLYFFNLRDQLAWSFSFPILNKILPFSFPLMLQGLFFWVLGSSDRTILGMYVKLSEVGVYTLAYQLAAILQLVNLAVSGSWQAYLFRVADDPAGRAHIPDLAVYYVSGLAFIGWGLAVFGVDFINLLTPPAYHRAVEVLPWLVISIFFNVLYQVWADTVLMVKQTRWLPVVAVAAAAVSLGLNLVFVPRFGILAAAFVNIAAFAVFAFGAYLLASRLVPLQHEYPRWLKAAGVALLLGTAAYMLPPLGSIWLSLAVKAALTLLWPPLLYLTGFWTRRELDYLKTYLAKKDTPA